MELTAVSYDSNQALPKFSLRNKAKPKFLHSCHIINSCTRNDSTVIETVFWLYYLRLIFLLCVSRPIYLGIVDFHIFL